MVPYAFQELHEMQTKKIIHLKSKDISLIKIIKSILENFLKVIQVKLFYGKL